MVFMDLNKTGLRRVIVLSPVLQFCRGGRRSRRLVSSEPGGDESRVKADPREPAGVHPGEATTARRESRPSWIAPRCAETTRNRASQQPRNIRDEPSLL